MITTLIILSYVLSVFLNRRANKLMYQKYNSIIWITPWFIPFLVVLILLIRIIAEKCNTLKNKSNWFTGKNW
jgi:hypothetical protein